MKNGLAKHGRPAATVVTDTWDLVQKNLECCGVSTYEDWFTSNSTLAENAVPDS